MNETEVPKPISLAGILQHLYTGDELRQEIIQREIDDRKKPYTPGHDPEILRPISDDERGNVVLFSEDRLKLAAWVRPFHKGDIWLHVEWVVENYPSFRVVAIIQTEHQLVKHINKELVGWCVNHCGIDGVNIKDGWIVEPEELETGARCPECGEDSNG